MPTPTPQQVDRVIVHIRRQIGAWTLVRGGLKRFREARIFTAPGIEDVLDGLVALADLKVSEASANLEVHEGIAEQLRSSILVPDLGRRH